MWFMLYRGTVGYQEKEAGLTVWTRLVYLVFSSPEPSVSQGELIVYPWSGVRRTSSVVVVVRPHFQTLLLWNRLTNQSQISCGAPLGRGNESLYKWSRSHDQNGRHAKNCSKSLKIIFSGTGEPISMKLGIWHRGHQPIIVYTNDNPGLTLT